MVAPSSVLSRRGAGTWGKAGRGTSLANGRAASLSSSMATARSAASAPVLTTRAPADHVEPVDARHVGGDYTVKDGVTIDVLPRTPVNNVYVGSKVWFNLTATKCGHLVSLNHVMKATICLQPLNCGQ